MICKFHSIDKKRFSLTIIKSKGISTISLSKIYYFFHITQGTNAAFSIDPDDPVYVSGPVSSQTYVVVDDYTPELDPHKHHIKPKGKTNSSEGLALSEGMCVEVIHKYEHGKSNK